MSVTINGTTGIAGVDGSAGTPAVQGSDTNTGVFFPAADTIAFGEGGTEVMRISSAGNVGIGTTTPAVKLDVVGAISASGAITAGGAITATGAIQASGVTTNIYPIVSDTAKTATSTSVDFTGIPSWVKRITVMFNGVSTSGTSNLLIQLGTSGGIVSTGYVSGAWTSNTSNVSSTAGVIITGANTAAATHYGIALVCNVSGNVWLTNYAGGWGAAAADVGGGSITLGGTLDRVRITTVNGTDTFDAGTINILYE